MRSDFRRIKFLQSKTVQEVKNRVNVICSGLATIVTQGWVSLVKASFKNKLLKKIKNLPICNEYLICNDFPGTIFNDLYVVQHC